LGQRLSSFYPAQYLCGLARSVRQRTQASRLGARLYVMPASGSGGIVRGCAPVCLHRVCGGMARHGIMATCKKKNGERSRGRAAERHPRTRVFIADDRTTANVRRDLACARARRSWGGRLPERPPDAACVGGSRRPRKPRKSASSVSASPGRSFASPSPDRHSRPAQRVLLVLLEECYGITLRRAGGPTGLRAGVGPGLWLLMSGGFAVSLMDMNRLNASVLAHRRNHRHALILGPGAGQFKLDGRVVLLTPDELITRYREERT
jgi:hypothetical protein